MPCRGLVALTLWLSVGVAFCQHPSNQEVDDEPVEAKDISEQKCQDDLSNVENQRILIKNDFNALLTEEKSSRDDKTSDSEETYPRYSTAGDEKYTRSDRAQDGKYMRFGRAPDAKYMRFGRGAPDAKYMRFGRGSDAKYMRFGRGSDAKYMRFGRGSDAKYMRFGRGSDSKYMRFGRGSDSKYMRFGRGSDAKYMRFGRAPDGKYMRFGRGSDAKYMRFGRPENTEVVHPLRPKFGHVSQEHLQESQGENDFDMNPTKGTNFRSLTGFVDDEEQRGPSAHVDQSVQALSHEMNDLNASHETFNESLQERIDSESLKSGNEQPLRW